MCVCTGLSICTSAARTHACMRAHASTRTRTRARTHTHTHNQAPSNPSVSKSRLSEMKVQSPGTESQPSKNVCRFPRLRKLAGVGSVSPSPRGSGLCLTGQPRTALRGWNSNLQPAGGLPACLPAHSPSSQEREGPALESPRHLRRGVPSSTPPPPPPRHQVFTPLFFLSLLPLPRESSPGSRCRPSSHPKLSPIH